MDSKAKGLLVILAMLAALVYTVINYLSGKIDTMFLLVCFAILGIPMMNMINILIRDWKNK